MSTSSRSASPSGSGSGSPNHISGRLQAMYDAFYEDAARKRVMKAAEKERRMSELSRLMSEPATAENVRGLSEMESAALRDAVEAEMRR